MLPKNDDPHLWYVKMTTYLAAISLAVPPTVATYMRQATGNRPTRPWLYTSNKTFSKCFITTRRTQCKALYCHRKLSVRLSLMTSRCHIEIGLLENWLYAHRELFALRSPTIGDLVLGNTHKFWPQSDEVAGGLRSQQKTCNIGYLIQCKTWLLLLTDRNLHTRLHGDRAVSVLFS